MIENQNPTTIEKKETKWSYSRLGCFEGCGFKYKLKYVDKNYVYSGSIAAEFGTAIHHAEESLANYVMSNTEIDYISVKNQFIIDCMKLKNKYYKDWFIADDYSKKTYEEKFYDYLNNGIYRLQNYLHDHPSYIIKGAEVKIDFRYNNKYRFIGAIDRLIFDTQSGKYIIQDIKSWPSIERHIDELPTPLQFVVYSLALAEMEHADLENISCQYDLPISGELVNAGTEGYIKRGQKKLDKLFKEIEDETFIPSPNRLCHWCEFCRTNPSAPSTTKWLCPYASSWTRDYQLDLKEFTFESLEQYKEDLIAYKIKHNVLTEMPNQQDGKK